MSVLAASAGQLPRRKTGFSLGELFDIMGAAIRAANAVDSHRQPKREDLLTLGITGDMPKAL